MSQDELPLEFEPYPGYWRVSYQPEPGHPLTVVWYAYEQKAIAEEIYEHAKKSFIHGAQPSMVLDPDFEPKSLEDDDEDKPEWLDWY